MTSSKTLFYFCLSFIFGIFIESLIPIPQIFIWAFLFLSIVIIFVSLLFLKNGRLILIGFCILFVMLGILRHQIVEFDIKNDQLSKSNDNGKAVVLIGVISDEPVKKDTTQNIKLNVGKETVLITTPRYPKFNYQDKLKVEGKLETPTETEDFSYKKYLQKDGIYSVMGFPKIELLQKNSCTSLGCTIYSKVLWIKQKLRESIRINYLPPESLILEGTILGDSSALTPDLKTKLNITGLRHIIAVSGTHVVILSVILMSLLLFFGLYRGQAFYFSVAFIWLYILLTGLPASGIRAGIMATIFLLAEKLGRQSHTERIIVLAAAVILLFNPLLLFYDAGFQLSFLAVLGLIYLDQPIRDFFKFIISKFLISKNKKNLNKEKASDKLENFLGMFSATLSAQIFTLPIMLYNFGNISLAAPITNLLILPTVEPLMILGFLSSFLGMASNLLGMIVSLPCYFLLYYFIKILDIFSQPWMLKTFENVSWIWLLICYLFLAILVWFIKRRNQKFIR